MASKPREAALDVLNRCCDENGWSTQNLENTIRRYSLDRRDTALTYRLALGVLQNTALLDFYINSFLQGKSAIQKEVRNILRLGAYQILYSDRIPDRAAVSESVELCRSARMKSASGLVNAVLRRISENKNSLPQIPDQSREQYLAVKYSHPQWLCKRLSDDFGDEEAENILKYDNTVPPLSVQVNPLKISEERFAEELERAGIAADSAGNGTFQLGGVSPQEVPGYSEGWFYVQDPAALYSVRSAQPAKNSRVLDACSAPGGKSFAAAICMENLGEIISCELHEKKLSLVEASAQRLGISIIKTKAIDARERFEPFLERFDTVIADVPCSGFGVIAKKPEIRFKNYESVSGLPAIQRAILENVSGYVRPGGKLLYSTCTIFHEENEDIVQEFLAEHREFQLASEKLFLPGKENCDGFYTALMIRE